MKLKKGVEPKVLLDYGFKLIDEKYKEEHGIDEYNTIGCFDGYIYSMGHSRRGQWYYLLCGLNGGFYLYSSEPDGSGGMIDLSKEDIFKKLIFNGITE